MHAGVHISSRVVQRRPLETGRKAKKPLKSIFLLKKWKRKITVCKINKYWTVEDREKVLFSDESHFFIQGTHSRFVRIRNGEQLNPVYSNELVEDPQKNMF